MASDGLGPLEFELLASLLERPRDAYGITIMERVAERTGRTRTLAAIYAALDRLQEKGMVSSWWGEPTRERGGRRLVDELTVHDVRIVLGLVHLPTLAPVLARRPRKELADRPLDQDRDERVDPRVGEPVPFPFDEGVDLHAGVVLPQPVFDDAQLQVELFGRDRVERLGGHGG